MNFNKYKLVKNQLYYKENSNSVRATNVQCIKYFQDIGFVDSRAILCHYCMCPWMTLLPLNVKKKKKKYYMSKKSTSLRKCTTYIDNQWSHKMLFYPFHQKKILPKNSNEYSAKYKSVTMARLFHKWLYFYIHINRNFFFINCWTKKSFPYILNWFSFWVKKKYQRLVYNKISCSDLLFSKSYQHMNKPEKWT